MLEVNRRLKARAKDKTCIGYMDSTALLIDTAGQRIREFCVDDPRLCGVDRSASPHYSAIRYSRPSWVIA